MNFGRLLAFSAILNLGLAGALVWRFATAQAGTTSDIPGQAAPRPAIKRVLETNFVTQSGAMLRRDWRTVENADYRRYIANLRAIGCPEETIRDIIILDINKLFMDRWHAAHPSRAGMYWDTSNSGVLRSGGRNSEDRERELAQLELTREKRDLVRDLLGVDLAEELARYHMFNSRAELENMWTFLSAEKREAVRQIQARNDELARTIRARADPDGRLSPELAQQLRDLKARTDSELSQAMTPAELEQYQLRMSSTATNLRLALSAFDPTEDEYKSIFPIRKAYDERWADPSFDRTDPEQLRQRTAAYQDMEEKIRTVLSPERFADYLRSRDNDYRDYYRFTKLWELPRETLNTLYLLKQATDAEIKSLRADASLDAGARKASLAEIQAQAQAAIKTTLGERAYQGFLRSGRNRQTGAPD